MTPAPGDEGDGEGLGESDGEGLGSVNASASGDAAFGEIEDPVLLRARALSDRSWCGTSDELGVGTDGVGVDLGLVTSIGVGLRLELRLSISSVASFSSSASAPSSSSSFFDFFERLRSNGCSAEPEVSPSFFA